MRLSVVSHQKYGKSTINCNLDGLLTHADVFVTIMIVYFNAYEKLALGMPMYSRKVYTTTSLMSTVPDPIRKSGSVHLQLVCLLYLFCLCRKVCLPMYTTLPLWISPF